MAESEFNKLARATLLAGVIAVAAGIGAEKLYHAGGEHHGKEAPKRGYTIAGADTAGAEGGSASAEPAKPVDITPFMAKADAAAGEALSKRCTSCHTFDKGGKNGVGPNQWGLVGSHFAHAEGFAYSAAMAGMKDKKWDFQALSDFLASPSKYIPGNKMAFAGMKKPEDRANLIAWLNNQSDNPVPLPK